MFLTPTSKALWSRSVRMSGTKFQANISQDNNKVEKVHKIASKANRSNPRISLGTHTRTINGIRTTKE